MALSDKIYKIFPVSVFIRIRNLYQKVKKIIYPALTENQFKELLIGKMGIKNGDVVFIHSSIDKMNISFSFLRIIPILQEIVGEEGTLVFPCWHISSRAEDYLRSNHKPFNVKRTSTVMGLLPELARKLKGAHRSLHPFNSMVAIGKQAEYIVKEHHNSIYPNGDFSPLYRIKELKGKIIGLGERTVSLSFVHVVEDIMKEKFPRNTLTDEVFTETVIDYNKNEILVETKAPSINIKNRDIPSYLKNNITQEVCKEFQFLGNNYFIADADKLFERMKALAERGFTIYID